MRLQNRFYTCAIWCLSLSFSGLLSTAWSQVSSTLINSTNAAIDTIRKRDCSITIANSNGQALSGLAVSVKQIRHHFGFGAAIGYNILSDTNLQKVFLNHFEWAVFDNDLKWPATDPTADGPDYSRADSLLAFCQKNGLNVRGHNLFWNQKSDWLPTWTLTLNTTDFKSAVDKRIENALPHYKGKIPQWDIANEVIHGTEFETRTGNQNIWNYIFDKCRKTDSTLKLAINDFNIIERYSDIDKYITKINAIRNPSSGTKGPIDIIGLEGHFGGDLNQTDYKAKLDKIAAVGLPLWFTEVDFSVAKNVRADRFEELIRTSFANAKVEGFMMWTFWQGNLWRTDLTSFIADSVTYAINDLGVRYESLMKLWTTAANGSTNTSGKYSFRGFQGRYVVTTTLGGGGTQVDTIYLEPGQGAKAVSIVIRNTRIAVNRTDPSSGRTFRINGTPVTISAVFGATDKLFVSLYSTSGRLLSRQRVGPNTRDLSVNVSTGCYIIGVGTSTETLATSRISLH